MIPIDLPPGWAIPPASAISCPASADEMRLIARSRRDACIEARRRERATFPIPAIPLVYADIGNISAADVVTAARYMADNFAATAPVAAGTLTINSQSLGSYDVAVFDGDHTVSSFSSNTYFTTTADSRSAWVIFRGNLTIDAAQVFTPSARKLFTVVYVVGNLTVNGTISMTGKGANHSASGSNIAAADIRIATGTFSAVVNPRVQSGGGSGGAARTTDGQNPGTAGSTDQTGGGGSGGYVTAGGQSGAGAAGTAFSGGPGGGGGRSTTNGNPGNASGGAGGAGAAAASCGGGAGNPGGAPSGAGASTGGAGTGGTLIVLCEKTYSGSGSVTAAGVAGGAASDGAVSFETGGGGSGGGHATVLVDTDSAGPTPSATGGPGGVSAHSGTYSGGDGGAGTARKLTGL